MEATLKQIDERVAAVLALSPDRPPEETADLRQSWNMPAESGRDPAQGSWQEQDAQAWSAQPAGLVTTPAAADRDVIPSRSHAHADESAATARCAAPADVSEAGVAAAQEAQGAAAGEADHFMLQWPPQKRPTSTTAAAGAQAVGSQEPGPVSAAAQPAAATHPAKQPPAAKASALPPHMSRAKLQQAEEADSPRIAAVNPLAPAQPAPDAAAEQQTTSHAGARDAESAQQASEGRAAKTIASPLGPYDIQVCLLVHLVYHGKNRNWA